MLVVLLVTFWIALVSSIRVPTSWDDLHKFRTIRLQGSETSLRNLQPYGVPAYVNSQYYDNERHRDLKNRKNLIRHQTTAGNLNNWVPVVPNHYQQRLSPIFPNHYRQPERVSPIITNYRDDRTHEPEIDEDEPEIQRDEEKSEEPEEIPTKPIYPGEGQWAIKGKKHKPFISKHQFSQLKNDNEEDKPEGFEVFQENQNVFNRQYDSFDENLNNLPKNHKLGSFVEDDRKPSNEETSAESEDDEFTPVKIYTQVRRSENEEHLPVSEAEDPRLREVVRDSKIQTVYTEEGYEDEAYDHEGHEKNAEQSEGSAEFDKDVEKENSEDAEAAGSEYEFNTTQKPMTKMKMSMNNLITTKEVKTTEVKDKGDGTKGKQLEISSEIKVVVTPNNGTKSHRFVKIFPKIYRYDQIEATTETVNLDKSEEESKKGEEVANVTEVGRPTEAVKNETEFLETLESMTNKFYKRFKRFTPDLKVDTDFVTKIAEENARPLPKTPEKKTKPKYPYYNDRKINPLSPLRYSEDLGNIPQKQSDDLAFYNQANKRVECQEVESEVDPIPERIKKADKQPEDMEDTTDVQELVKGPRLGNLGDKIDCFKLKFWGEDPLDNPIFKETEVEPVLPLFNLPRRFKNEINTTPRSTNSVIDNEIESHDESTTKIDTDLNTKVIVNETGKDEVKSTTQVLKEEATSTTEIPTISIITTPKYTIDLKPKHIYDQIQLLDHLPPFNFSSSSINSSATNFGDNSTTRSGKNLEEAAMLQAESNPKGQQEEVISQNLPESQALYLRKRRRRLRPSRRPPFHYIFDVNRFIPPPQSRLNYYQPSNNQIGVVVPRRKVLSEVHYKDEIRPDEQLNVFSDVINNIKNSSKDLKVASSGGLLNSYNVRVSPFKDAIYAKTHLLDNIEESNSFYLTTSTTTMKPTTSFVRKRNNFYKIKNNDQVYDDLLDQYDNLEILRVGQPSTLKPHRRNKISTTTTSEPYEDHVGDATSLEDEDDPQVDEQPDEVDEQPVKVPLGLRPPGLNQNYKTIYNPVMIRAEDRFKAINQFLVEGMKPPSLKQKIYLYSDFKIPGIQVIRRRYKRSPARGGYSEVVRNRNKPIDSQDDQDVVVVEEEDDYVPHRPKNYHYDEKTGRIVYDNPQKSIDEETKSADSEEEVEYIEVTDAPIPKPNRRNQVTTPRWIIDPNTPSYVDYLKKVKKNPSYVHIPDPTTTTTEKDASTTTTTTAQPVSTNPPEFLSILSKVRTDPSYKPLEDEKDKKKSRTTTTTEAPEEFEEVIEETREAQQNSPGGQLFNSPTAFQIFDISEYLPKVKNYSPRTSIDTSKYKTIERPNVRHNLSSRYSEDESLADVNTMRVPILATSQPEINPEMSESKVEEKEETPTTTNEPITTSTTKRSRVRTRGSRPSTTRRPSSTTTVSLHSRRRPTTTTSSPAKDVIEDAVEDSSVQHDKPKRVIRRRPTRIKLRTTTEGPSPVAEESEDTTKIVRRRSQTANKNVPAQKIQPRVVMAPKNNSKSDEDGKLPRRLTARRVDSDVEVFQKYDKTKKHGGNYKRKEEDEEQQQQGDKSEEVKDPEVDESGNKEVKRLTDVVPKPVAYFTDPKLPKNVNQLIESTTGNNTPLLIDLNEEEGQEEESGEESEPDYDQEGSAADEDASESEEKKNAPKKPVFIKDPSKRLYYYAPI